MAAEQLRVYGHGRALGNKDLHLADFDNGGSSHGSRDAGVVAARARGPAAVGDQPHIGRHLHRLRVLLVERAADRHA